MIEVWTTRVLMVLFSVYIVISCVHSFNVSESAREDDMSINRYGED